MDRRKFIKTSMCLGCIAAAAATCPKPLLPNLSDKFSKDEFIYKRKEDLPKKIQVEACALCQLNCPACNIRLHEKDIVATEGFGCLKFSDFKTLVDDNPQLEEIELAHSGEIFLNPELARIIEYGHRKNIELNALAGVHLNELTDEMAECLVKYKLKNIMVSIDGATPETYKIYRVGGDFNQVIANVKKITKYKKMYNSEYPVIHWKFIVFGHNEHEIELAKQKAEELGVNIYFSPNYVPEYSPVKNRELVTKQTGLNLFEDIWLKGKREEILSQFCYDLFDEPQINWNGDLLGCCLQIDKNFGANVFKVGLLNALNSTMYVEAKHLIKDLSYKPKSNLPCLNCWVHKFVMPRDI